MDFGGGIGNDGTMTLTDCTISGNSAISSFIGIAYVAGRDGGIWCPECKARQDVEDGCSRSESGPFRDDLRSHHGLVDEVGHGDLLVGIGVPNAGIDSAPSGVWRLVPEITICATLVAIFVAVTLTPFITACC